MLDERFESNGGERVGWGNPEGVVGQGVLGGFGDVDAGLLVPFLGGGGADGGDAVHEAVGGCWFGEVVGGVAFAGAGVQVCLDGPERAAAIVVGFELEEQGIVDADDFGADTAEESELGCLGCEESVGVPGGEVSWEG